MARHTLQDVATLAGVSKATASRVLNGSVQVDPATRQRVLAAMAELDYTPSSRGAAAELRADAHDQRRHLVPDATAGGRTAARHRRGPGRQRVRPRHLQRRDASRSATSTCVASRSRSGPTACSSSPCRHASEDVRRLSSAAIPVVVIDAHAPAVEGLPHVVGDDIARRRGSDAASAGPRPPPHRVPGRRVRQPVRLHLEPPSLPRVRASHPRRPARSEPDLVALGRAQPLRGTRAGDAGSWRRRSRPTAIFAASDTQALGVISAAHEVGPARPRRPLGRRLRRHRDRRLPRAHDRAPAALRVRPPRRRAAPRRDRRAVQRRRRRSSCAPEVVVRGTTAPPKEGERCPDRHRSPAVQAPEEVRHA